MQRQSPPKHRHDGTSPLPLGMDWSPPPRVWAGRETVWPHDPRTGWSYCVTIPSWVVLAKSRDSDPIVFYRVHVSIQSPEGTTTSRTVLRRFNDFLKLHAALKRAFPRKSLPTTPSKGLLRTKTRTMLEERRISLEEWMAKLLSDIDLSRSMPVASFLELEAAARTSFQEDSQQSSDSNTSPNSITHSHERHPNLNLSTIAGSLSLASDYGSDTAYETSEVGTSSLGRDNNSDVGVDDMYLDDSLTGPIDKFVKYGMSNIDEGLSIGQAILEQLEGFPKHKLHAREIHNNIEKNKSNGSSSKASHHAGDVLELLTEPSHGTLGHHARKHSGESVGSDMSSQRGSDISSLAIPNSNGYQPADFPSGTAALKTATLRSTDFQLADDVQLVLPMDRRQKMNRVLASMQQRLITAKTDMEDLISRLNQESTIKDFLATKVKDLELELETTKQKSKENLEQAILIERERITQMQWDMEELRQRSMEMELKLNTQQGPNPNVEFARESIDPERDVLQQELASTKHELEDLSKRYQELEMKSKSDIKVLVKEVKSLRTSQSELKQQLDQSIKAKSMAEELLEGERERNEHAISSWMKLLHKCKILQDQLQECKVDFMHETEDIPSLNVLDLLYTSNKQISSLISEVQNMAQDDDPTPSSSDISINNDDTSSVDEELRRILQSILFDNAALRKQVISVTQHALELNNLIEKDGSEPAPDVNEQNDGSN